MYRDGNVVDMKHFTHSYLEDNKGTMYFDWYQHIENKLFILQLNLTLSSCRPMCAKCKFCQHPST